MRNIFINKGTGLIYDINGGKPILKENTFNAASTIFAKANGTNYSDLNTWLSSGFDTGSRTSFVTFVSDADLHIMLYIPEIVFNVPLFPGDNSYAGNIEKYDFDNEMRTSYFAGADEIFLAVNLEFQSTGFIDCEKSTSNSLTVSAIINYGAKINYQWVKDGIEIEGQNKPVLYFNNLKFAESGMYKCKIGGPGLTKSIYSNPVAVYASTPTYITVQPQNQYLPEGSVATLSFTAHVNGKKIEDAIINDEVKVQWYKWISETQSTPLNDNLARVSGSKSNYLTINNFTKADYAKYFAEITGLCGTVRTVPAELIEEVLDMTIIQQPSSITNCEGTDVVFNVDATSKSNKAVNYQWFKGSTQLTEHLPKIEGTNTKQLVIYSVDNNDAGEYYATVSLEGTQISNQSDKVQLNIKGKPEILTQPQGVTLNDGDDLLLEVVLADISDPTVKYQWYRANRPLLNAAAATYTKSKVSLGDATSGDQGEYWCVITNDCGTVTSANANVIITTGTTDISDVQSNGYSLSVPSPSPVNHLANVRYYLPNQANVKISLSDVQGSYTTELVNQMISSGEHFVSINASQMNISSGTYFLKLESNGVFLVQKIVVIK
jgi:hypothetical protein